MADPKRRRIRLTVLSLLGILAVMVGLDTAAVPLYRLFCQATGYNGTTQRAEKAPDQEVADRVITVRFNASVAADLPWEFRPLVTSVRLHPGEEKTISYRAINNGSVPITGTATHNVTPDKAGLYFDKIQCFCFTQQYLKAGESADLFVTFFVDPDIVKDPGTRDVDTITLSYTMFKSKTQGGPTAENAGRTPPSVAAAEPASPPQTHQ